MRPSQNIFKDAFDLIGTSYRKKGTRMVALLMANALLDFFSLASFLPVILLVIQPQPVMPYGWLQRLHALTGLDDPVYVAVVLMLAALLFILIKTQAQVWITLQKATYAYAVATDLATRAMTHHLGTSYTKFANTDYTRQMYRISDLPFTFANNIIIPFGTIVSEVLVSFLVLGCIALYNPFIFIFLVLILIPIALIYGSKRIRIKRISKEIKTTYPLLLKYTLQAVEGLLEMRAFRKEGFFTTRFTKTHRAMGMTLAHDHSSSTSASRFTELIAALFVGTLIIYALLSRQSYSETLLLLSLYAGASFRIIPSINRIFSASLQLKTHEYVVHELMDMTSPSEGGQFEDTGDPLPFTHSIELRNITFGYEGHTAILRDATLSISKGEKVALRGKSGSGKTSLLLILLRFVKESQGEISIDGKKLEENDAVPWRKHIGYVSQNPYVLDASLAENIAFGIPPDQIDLSLVRQLLADLELNSWANGLPEGLQTIIGEKGVKISGGQRQRLAIARALYQNAEILLLDEVTNQLDKQTEQEVMDLIRKGSLQHKTIIMVSHQANPEKVFDSVYELQNGRLERVNADVKVKV